MTSLLDKITGRQKGGNYGPLSANAGDLSDEEEIFDRRMLNHSENGTTRPSDSNTPPPRTEETDEIIELRDVEDDEPLIDSWEPDIKPARDHRAPVTRFKDSSSRQISCCRAICVCLSILGGIIVGLLFYFVLPCAFNECNEIDGQWNVTLDDLETVTSLRMVDIGNDGVRDILVGGKVSRLYYPDDQCALCKGMLMALNGSTGQIIWKRALQTPVTAINCGGDHVLDVNQDGVPECLAVGNTVVSVNILDGKVMWQTNEDDTSSSEGAPLYPLIVADYDGDNVSEVVETRTGNDLSGRLRVLSGLKGSIGRMPLRSTDGLRIHSPAVLYPGQGGNSEYIIFGSGNQSTAGSLWAISVTDLYSQLALPPGSDQYSETPWTDKNSPIPLHHITKLKMSAPSGVAGPVVLVDLTGDNVLDFLVSFFNGTVIAIDGQTLAVLWTNGDKQSRSSDPTFISIPAIGYFDKDDIPDLTITMEFAITKKKKQVLVLVMSGGDGEVLWATTSASPLLFTSSPLALQTSDKNDAFLFWRQEDDNDGDVDFYDMLQRFVEMTKTPRPSELGQQGGSQPTVRARALLVNRHLVTNLPIVAQLNSKKMCFPLGSQPPPTAGQEEMTTTAPLSTVSTTLTPNLEITSNPSFSSSSPSITTPSHPSSPPASTPGHASTSSPNTPPPLPTTNPPSTEMPTTTVPTTPTSNATTAPISSSSSSITTGSYTSALASTAPITTVEATTTTLSATTGLTTQLFSTFISTFQPSEPATTPSGRAAATSAHTTLIPSTAAITTSHSASSQTTASLGLTTVETIESSTSTQTTSQRSTVEGSTTSLGMTTVETIESSTSTQTTGQGSTVEGSSTSSQSTNPSTAVTRVGSSAGPSARTGSTGGTTANVTSTTSQGPGLTTTATAATTTTALKSSTGQTTPGMASTRSGLTEPAGPDSEAVSTGSLSSRPLTSAPTSQSVAAGQSERLPSTPPRGQHSSPSTLKQILKRRRAALRLVEETDDCLHYVPLLQSTGAVSEVNEDGSLDYVFAVQWVPDSQRDGFVTLHKVRIAHAYALEEGVQDSLHLPDGLYYVSPRLDFDGDPNDINFDFSPLSLQHWAEFMGQAGRSRYADAESH